MLAGLLYDQDKVNEYRKTAMELRALRQKVEQQLDTAIESGNKHAARGALAELKASGETFKELRNILSPTDLFIAKYNIQVHGPHEVSFVPPKGVSRYEMLCGAQALVEVRENRVLVWPTQLKKWKDDKTFQASCIKPERIQIDGHVEGGDGKTRVDQEAFLKGKALPQANLEDLAAAFVAYRVATGEPLFGWWDKASQWSFVVRAAGGALVFNGFGLSVNDVDDGNSGSLMAVSLRVPRNSKSR